MFNKKIVFAVLGLFLAGLALYGCGQVAGGGGTVSYSVINGTVKDTSGNAISGVRVTTSVATADTNSQGYFSLSNISTTREVVVFSKTNQLTTQRVVSLTAGQSVFVDAVMVPGNAAQTLASATAGGTITDTSSTGLSGSVTLPSNSLVRSIVNAHGVRTMAPVTGPVNVAVTPFDPTTSPEAFPSGFTGVSSTGATVPFKSFGFINVTITDPTTGATVELTAGKAATIKLEVPVAMQADAAAIGTIPLWFINSSGNWQEEGLATWDAATKMFVGTVVHFSSWNCDMPYSTAYVTGKVVDANGSAVPNAEVRIKAANNTWSSFGNYSKSDGTFGPIAVEAGASCVAFATKNGIRSANKTFTAGAASTTTDIGNLVLTAPLVQITLTWGANPRDLDSHLTIPGTAEGGVRYDSYYGNIGARQVSIWPYVNLDTDDTSSYGPEITSIYKLLPGVYRFNVHHYSGTSDITNSSANVNLIISGGGTSSIYNFTPPSGLTTGAGDVWQVCDITIDSSGNVSGVSTLNGVLHGISASDHASFSPSSGVTAAGVVSAGAVKQK